MKKITLALLLLVAAFKSHAQWTTGTNVSNTNTGFVGVNTSLYVSDAPVLGSLYSGSMLLGRHMSAGVYIPPAEWQSGIQHYIHIDQPSTRILLSNGNSDQGGGIQRPNANSGETRIFTLPSYGGDHYLTFVTNTTERMRINNAGNIGIGLTNPSTTLQIASPANNGVVIGTTPYPTWMGTNGLFVDGSFKANTYLVSSGSSVNWGASEVKIAAYNPSIGSNTYMQFYTGALERMRINHAGYVGIGTDDPKTNLHIVGPGASVNGGSSYTYNGSGMIIQANTGGRSTTTGAQLEFVIPASTSNTNFWGQARIVTVAGNTNTTDATGKMILGTRRMFNKPGTSSTEWFYGDDITIDGAGNVGIQTTTPAYPLDIAGHARLATGKSFYFDNSAGSVIRQDNGGAFVVAASNNGGNNGNVIVNAATGKAVYLNYFGGQNVFFGNGASGVTGVIQASGNMGIGTLDPKGYKLAVGGNAIAEQMIVKLQADWPDFVFKRNFMLPSLDSVERYIDKNQHLPEMPTAEEVKANGQNLGEMNRLLLKKVEELTLYLIEENKKSQLQQLQLKEQQQKLTDLQREVSELKKRK